MADDDDNVLPLTDRVPSMDSVELSKVTRFHKSSTHKANVHPLATKAERHITDLMSSEGLTLQELSAAVRRMQGKTSCTHGHYIVDEGARTVECSDCGAMIDPFDCVERIAKREQYLYSRLVDRKALHRELGALRAQVERLRKDEANAKARVKRAKNNLDKAEAVLDIDRAVLDRYREWHRRLRQDREDWNAYTESERKSASDERRRLWAFLEKHL